MTSICTIPFYVGFYQKFKFNNEKQTIYLLGQGWLAKGFLDNIDRKKYYIINLSKNEFINTPLILSKLKNNKLNVNINLSNKVDEYYDEEVNNIDLINNVIITNKKLHNFNNKIIVCGLGSNIDQGAHWNNVINNINLTLKKNTKINIVGAGPTGTELSFYLSDIGYNVKIIDSLNVNELYSYLSSESKIKILESLAKSNIEVVANRFYNNKIDKGHVIFATGTRPNTITNNWKITDTLQLEKYNNIFAGGDCINQSYPRNAQVAYQQGVYIAKKLNGDINEKFKFINNGIALYCGNNNYLIETSNKINIIIPSIFVELFYRIKEIFN